MEKLNNETEKKNSLEKLVSDIFNSSKSKSGLKNILIEAGLKNVSVFYHKDNGPRIAHISAEDPNTGEKISEEFF